jgi:1-acyl-sn-glycerol-3-phosphate acyltransferase
MFAALKLLAVWIGLGVPAAMVAIPWAAMRNDFRLMYRWGMGIVRLGVRAAGVRVRVEGSENLPGQPCIFVSNHVSNMDAPVLLPSLPGMSSVFIKKKLMGIPILGMAMRMGKYIPVSRGHSREEAQKSVEYAAEVLRGGRNIVLFPEGTTVAGRESAAVQEGRVFSGRGDRSADGAGGDPGDSWDDAQGELQDLSRRGGGAVSAGDVAGAV